jgi:hypothetical protein
VLPLGLPLPFRRRYRILANNDHGFNPYGQFFNQKIVNFDMGFYPAFQACDIGRT